MSDTETSPAPQQTAEPLDARDIRMGDKQFRIVKLLPIEAHDLLMDHVLPLLQGAQHAITGSANGDGDSPPVPSPMDGPLGLNMASEKGQQNSTDNTKLVLAIIGFIPAHHVKACQRVMFQYVTWTSPAKTNPTPITSDMNGAFAGLEAWHILELTGRCFAVNFAGSWDALSSRFPRLAGITHQLAAQT